MGRIKRTYKKKKKKVIFKSKTFWIASILVGTFLFFVILLLFNPFYQLEEVELDGINLTTENSLINFVKQNSKKRLFFKNSSSLLINSNFQLENKILDSYPHIEDIKIKKVFPDRLEISVTEREKEAIWCKGEKNNKNCYKFDGKGVVYQSINKLEDDDFEIYQQINGDISLGKRPLMKNKIKFIFKAKKELGDLFDLKRMTIPHKESLFVETKEDFEVRFNFEDDLNDQIERLDILLNEEIEELDGIEYIELRYGNSVYYK